VPSDAEIRDAAQRIRWVMLQAPPDRRLAVLREEIAKLPEDMRPMVEDLTSLGVQAVNDKQTAPRWLPVAAVIFAAITMLSLFYLLVRPEDIAATKHPIFDVWFSFCLAASFSFIGGTAQASGRIPIFNDSPLQFMVVGGVAVFIIALVIMFRLYP
jgi:hypothetical protein